MKRTPWPEPKLQAHAEGERQGGATTVIGRRKDEPIHRHYLRLLDGGMKLNLAKLTNARQNASALRQSRGDSVPLEMLGNNAFTEGSPQHGPPGLPTREPISRWAIPGHRETARRANRLAPQ